MPSKFSHSVVLAHYSSQGLIDLPNNQHLAYLNSYPPSNHSTSNSTSRVQAHTNRNLRARSVCSNGRDLATAGQVSSTAQPRGSRDDLQDSRRCLIIDPNIEKRHQSGKADVKTTSDERPASKAKTLPNPPSIDVQSFGLKVKTDQEHAAKLPSAPTCVRPGSSQKSNSTKSDNSSRKATSIGDSDGEAICDSVRSGHSATSIDARNLNLDYDDYVTKLASRTPRSVRGYQAPPPDELHHARQASPVDSAITQSTVPSKKSRNPPISRSPSAFTTDTRIFNPLPEDANFDGFSDIEEPRVVRNFPIHGSGSISKARNKAEPERTSQPEVSLEHRGSHTQERQRAPWRDESSREAGSSPSLPLHSKRDSRYSSLDSLSSPGSFRLPIGERPHQFNVNSQTANQGTHSPVRLTNLFSSEDDQRESLSSSLFELQSSSRDSSETKYLKLVRRDPALRQLLDNNDEGEMESHSKPKTNAVCPPDIAMYRVGNGVGSPLAQVELMLQKREDQEKSKNEGTKGVTGLVRADKIKELERMLQELKDTESGTGTSTVQSSSVKLKKKNSDHSFLKRFMS